MTSDRSILRMLGLQLARYARGVARPVSISTAQVPAGRASSGGSIPVTPGRISGETTCVVSLPSRTVGRGLFSEVVK